MDSGEIGLHGHRALGIVVEVFVNVQELVAIHLQVLAGTTAKDSHRNRDDATYVNVKVL